MLKAVYPGTFDPFTRGHEDVVRRASGLFEEIIVGVAASEALCACWAAERIAGQLALSHAALRPVPA